MDEQKIAFAEELLKYLRAEGGPVNDLITFYGYLSNELMRAMEFAKQNGEDGAERIFADETAGEIIKYLLGYPPLCECLLELPSQRRHTSRPFNAHESKAPITNGSLPGLGSRTVALVWPNLAIGMPL